MDILKGILAHYQFWLSIIAIIAAVIGWKLIKQATERFFMKENMEGRRATNTGLGLMVIRYIILAMAVIFILQINGVDISALITGLGVISIVVGFALQDILKDLLMGTYIVWDKFFSIGDVVKYNDIVGKVIAFNIKVTKLHDINTDNIVTISNRNISQIEVMSDWQIIHVPASYRIPVGKARDICEDIRNKIEKLDNVTSCEFQGTDRFDESQIMYRMLIHCNPELRNIVRRQAYGIIQDVYEENGIEIPYIQLDVHVTK